MPSLDDIIVEDCSEGFITYEELEIGEEHTFQVSAYIPGGGVDTTPVYLGLEYNSCASSS